MQMHEVSPEGHVTIEGYGPGFFRVGGKLHRGAILVIPGGVRPWGGFEDIAPLADLAGAVDVLIIGTGPGLQRLPQALSGALDAAAIPFEAMATPPAARSQVVLMDEGRRVALALLPV